MFTLLRSKIKSYILSVISVLASLPVLSQSTKENKSEAHSGYSKIISAGITIPFGEFTQTHWLGAGVNFSWSKNRFGIIDKKPSKPIGFIAYGGIHYYFGKKETVSSYPYQYNGFTYIHTYGGIIHNCGKNGNINLTTGPALGLENGFTTFFWGVNLSGAYYINEKIAITPGIIFMKDPESYDPLLSCSIKASWAF
jgi:hypothetical protein